MEYRLQEILGNITKIKCYNLAIIYIAKIISGKVHPAYTVYLERSIIWYFKG